MSASTPVSVAGHYLNRWGRVGELTVSTVFRWQGYSGDFEAFCRWSAPLDFTAPWFRAGARVRIGRWAGYLGDAVHDGTGWQIPMYGDGAETRHYLGPPPGTGDLANAITTANTLGLRWRPWANSFAFDGPSGSIDTSRPSGYPTLDQALDTLAAAHGSAWWVSGGEGMLRTPAGTPTWVMRPHATSMGTTEQGLVNFLMGTYVASVDADGNPQTYGTVTASDPESITQHRFHADTADLIAGGPLGITDAQYVVAKMLQTRGGRLPPVNGFTITATNCRSARNAVTDLMLPMLVRAGDLIVIPGVGGARNSKTYRPDTRVVAGKVTYSHATQSAEIEPLGAPPRDEESLLRQLVAKTRAIGGYTL